VDVVPAVLLHLAVVGRVCIAGQFPDPELAIEATAGGGQTGAVMRWEVDEAWWSRFVFPAINDGKAESREESGSL